MRVTLGKSRVRESRTPGSVRAKAEWLSYSTATSEIIDSARASPPEPLRLGCAKPESTFRQTS